MRLEPTDGASTIAATKAIPLGITDAAPVDAATV